MPDTVLVTGASRGLGRYCAERLQESGYRVVGFARKPDPAASFEIVPCDVRNADSVKTAFESFRRDSSVYALVNAAGTASLNLLISTPVETIQRIVETNLLGTIYCCQSVMRSMIRRRSGRIVNFSTIAVPLSLKGEAVYVASKSGVEGFSRSFAREMADHGVTVNVIAPGPIDTDLIAKVPRQKILDLVNQQIIPRQATPDDIYRILTLLLSAEGAMISGEVIHVGGA